MDGKGVGGDRVGKDGVDKGEYETRARRRELQGELGA
jgi:hypothetical protein